MLKLKAALLAPYPFWLLILAVGVGPTILIVGVSRDMMVLAGICTVLLKVFIFGRILSRVLPDRVSGFWAILRKYGGHYLVVAILLGLMALAIRMVVAGELTTRSSFVLVSGAARGAVAAITIYVWPLVFLNRSSVAAVLAGIPVLVGNFVSSLWIVGIAVAGEAILTVGQLLYVDHRTGWGLAAWLVANLAYIYLDAVVFAAALYRLLGVRIVDPESGA